MMTMLASPLQSRDLNAGLASPAWSPINASVDLVKPSRRKKAELPHLSDELWGLALDFLSTVSPRSGAVSSVDAAISLALLLSGLPATTPAHAHGRRNDRWSLSPVPSHSLGARGYCGRIGGGGGAKKPALTQVCILPLVCRAWMALFRGSQGLERRPRAWLKRLLRVDVHHITEAGYHPEDDSSFSDDHDHAAFHASARQRLQVVRSFNAANAARSLEVSPLASLAGLDPFHLDLWQAHRDTWWQAMRTTVSRMAKQRWAVDPHSLRLTLRGVTSGGGGGGGGAGSLLGDRSLWAELDSMARELLPVAHANGRLAGCGALADEHASRLRAYAEAQGTVGHGTVGGMGSGQGSSTSSASFADPGRLFALVEEGRSSRPPPPSLLRSVPASRSSSAGGDSDCHDGDRDGSAGGQHDELLVHFSRCEVDADNYEEARYGGLYGPVDHPHITHAHRCPARAGSAVSARAARSARSPAKRAGGARASPARAAAAVPLSASVVPFSLHLSIDPSPRPSAYPLRLEVRVCVVPARLRHLASFGPGGNGHGNGGGHNGHGGGGLDDVPHLLLEGHLCPFTFDTPLALLHATKGVR